MLKVTDRPDGIVVTIGESVQLSFTDFPFELFAALRGVVNSVFGGYRVCEYNGITLDMENIGRDEVKITIFADGKLTEEVFVPSEDVVNFAADINDCYFSTCYIAA